MTTPAAMPNNSQGSQVAAESSEICSGEVVSDSATSGASVPRTPSPRFARPVEVSWAANGRPSPFGLPLATSVVEGAAVMACFLL